MKKITAFFMAIMPIFVTALLFISGLIVKNVTHVEVRSVEISQNTLDIKLEDDSKQETFQLDSNVLPKNATNPEVYWTSSDENVVKVDNTGLVSTIGYGEAFIYLTSKENPTLQDKCKVEVWDDRIHKIVIDNKYDASYLAYGNSVKLQTHTVPSGGRLKVDPTLVYSSTSSQITVAQDGTITSTGESDTDAVVAITTKPQEGQPEIKQEVKVSIKPGVSEIAPKQKTKTVTSFKKYNFAQEIVSFPDNNVPASDYEYSSSDESIAKVSNEEGTEGLVTFNQKNTPVEITATYKRNRSLFVTKQISSTCDYLNKVYFNMYQDDYDWNSLPDDKTLDIGYGTYPTATDNTHIKFYSTDNSVVLPEYNQSEKKWQFKAKGLGAALLVASITLDDQGHTAFDTCLITIKDSTASNLFKQNEITTNSYYYSLRDNLIDDYDTLLVGDETIEWSIQSGEDYATLDATNWIVHFKPDVESTDNVVIKATVGNRSYQFTLSCNPPEEIDLDASSETYKIKVGQKYTFGSIYYVTSLSEDAFDTETDALGNIVSFVPKTGGTYETTLRMSLFVRKDIKLIVEEAPIAIRYKDNYKIMSHTTATVVKTRELLEPTIVPSSAAKADGKGYLLNIDYTYDKSEVTVVEDTLTFKEDSVVIAKISIEEANVEPDYLGIHSSCGFIGKFTLKDGTTPMKSGGVVSLNVDETKTLALDKTYLSEHITEQTVTQFKIESLNGNNITECSSRWTGDNVVFDIKATASGSDTIHVFTPTFSFFINVNVAEKITDLGLYYHGTAINNANSMLTVTPTFKLIATGKPITAETVLSATISSTMGSASTVTIDQTTKAVSVQLNDGKGDYVLTITGTNGLTGPISKQWKFKYSTDLTDIKVGLLESDASVKPQGTQGTLFMGSNHTSLTTTIVINNGVAIVPQQFYTYFKLKIGDTTLKPIYNKFTIKNIPAPTTASPGYEKDIQLICDIGTGEQTVGLPYHISREVVSKIVLPEHDNNDQTDKKGLQKVHVYGNKTFQSPEEGLVNYYKLPINLYNFENKLIEGDAKKTAYDQLVKTVMVGKTVKENASQYLAYTTTQYNPEGFVAVTFDPSGFYSTKEMYDDAFANEAMHKNFTVDFHTHTALADANYMFVTVEGVNAYCQEGLLRDDWQRYEEKSVVLQVDFAKEDVPFSKTNVPLGVINKSWTNTIFGNGHTINFTNQYLASKEKKTSAFMDAHNIFNTTLQGVDSKIATPQTRNEIDFNFRLRCWDGTCPREIPHYCCYCNFNYFRHGLDVNDTYETGEGLNFYVKKCIFHDNFTAGCYSCCTNGKFYLEDSVFFNAAAFAVTNKKGGNTHLKGFVDVYNFKTGHEIFDNIEGYKLPWVWDRIVKKYAEEYKVIQYNHAGQQVINSCMGNIMGGSFYFFTGYDEQGKPKYEILDHGTQLAAKHVFNFINFPTTFIGEIGMWATRSPDVEPDCPSYNDEFNEQDQIRVTFYEANIKKVTRQYTWF